MSIEEQLEDVLDEYKAIIMDEVCDVMFGIREEYVKELNNAVWRGSYKRSLHLTGAIEAMDALCRTLFDDDEDKPT